jgi:hypothetical protein
MERNIICQQQQEPGCLDEASLAPAVEGADLTQIKVGSSDHVEYREGLQENTHVNKLLPMPNFRDITSATQCGVEDSRCRGKVT